MAKEVTKLNIKYWFLAIFLLVIIVVGWYYYINNKNYLHSLFYLDDRITGTIFVSVEGKEYSHMKKSIEYENNGTERLQTVNASKGQSFTIEGGEYGLYKLTFSLENKDLYEITGESFFDEIKKPTPINILFFNTNNWHVVDLTIFIELNKIEEDWIITTSVTEEYLGEIPLPTHLETFNYVDIAASGATLQIGP